MAVAAEGLAGRAAGVAAGVATDTAWADFLAWTVRTWRTNRSFLTNADLHWSQRKAFSLEWDSWWRLQCSALLKALWHSGQTYFLTGPIGAGSGSGSGSGSGWEQQQKQQQQQQQQHNSAIIRCSLNQPRIPCRGVRRPTFRMRQWQPSRSSMHRAAHVTTRHAPRRAGAAADTHTPAVVCRFSLASFLAPQQNPQRPETIPPIAVLCRAMSAFYITTRPYAATLVDEVSLMLDDKVQLIANDSEFGDGWYMVCSSFLQLKWKLNLKLNLAKFD